MKYWFWIMNISTGLGCSIILGQFSLYQRFGLRIKWYNFLKKKQCVKKKCLKKDGGCSRAETISENLNHTTGAL